MSGGGVGAHFNQEQSDLQKQSQKTKSKTRAGSHVEDDRHFEQCFLFCWNAAKI
jgi:hypothetical protein